MEIGMMCQETSISTFVDNVDDIQLLLKSVSPTVQKLMENGFNETKFTQRVRSVDWNITDDVRVFGMDTTGISQKDFEKKLAKEKGEKENTQV